MSTPRGRLPVAFISGDEDVDSSPITHVSRGRSTPNTARRQQTSTRSIPQKSPAAAPAGNEPITIFLRDQNTGEETYFSLRYKSTLRIVFTVFAERRGLNQDLLKFSYKGQTLTGYETPHSLNLDDRARIDVIIGQRR